MQLCVLGSSSAGNCTIIWDEDHSVLIDCGFSPRYIEGAMHALSLKLSTLKGVLITHVHGDHVNPLALGHLLRHKIPVIVPRKVARVLEHRFDFFRLARERNLVQDPAGSGLEVGNFDVRSFPVPHDAPGGCHGFSITSGAGHGKKRVTIATDLGYPQEGLEESFVNSDVVVVESNHDLEMLENSGRPLWLKRRIREIGHLSNDQCAGFLLAILEQSARIPHTVVLAHISQECNTNERAVRCTRERLDGGGFSNVRILPTFQYLPNAVSIV
jgi:phosphoribosyl 1,2-cyclic phosphodiesterase